MRSTANGILGADAQHTAGNASTLSTRVAARPSQGRTARTDRRRRGIDHERIAIPTDNVQPG